MSELDDTNKEILRLLCQDSRYQYTQIQKRLKKKGHNLTREAVEYRVKKMIESGTIKKFAMITDPEKLGYKVCIYLEIWASSHRYRDELGLWLASLPNTAYVHGATTLFDLAARIFFSDHKGLIGFLDSLDNDPRVEDFAYDIIRKTYKVGPIEPA